MMSFDKKKILTYDIMQYEIVLDRKNYQNYKFLIDKMKKKIKKTIKKH